MRFWILVLLLILVTPAHAGASGGITKHGETEITYTKMQTSTFDFEILDYNQPTLVDDLGLDFTQTDFVNSMGSIAVTIIALVSEYALLSSIVLVVIAILAMIWLLGIVLNRRMDAQLRAATADLPTNEQLFELADDQSEYRSLVAGRDREISLRRENIRSNRFTERISRSRLFAPIRGTYRTGGGVHRLSRGGGGFRRRRDR